MPKIFKDRSFRLSIILTFVFFGTGIAFLFLGRVDYSWILFALLPLLLGISIGIRQEHDYVFANLTNDLERKYGK